MDISRHPGSGRPHRHRHRRQLRHRPRDGAHAGAQRGERRPRLPQPGAGEGGARQDPRRGARRARVGERARPLRPRVGRGVRGELRREARAARSARQQRGRDDPAARPDEAGLRASVRDESPRALRADRASPPAPRAHAAGARRGRVEHGAELRPHRDGRSQLGAPLLRRLVGLRTEQAREHDVPPRAAAAPDRGRLEGPRHGGAPRLDGHGSPARVARDAVLQSDLRDEAPGGGATDAASGDGPRRGPGELLGSGALPRAERTARDGAHPAAGPRRGRSPRSSSTSARRSRVSPFPRPREMPLRAAS